MKVSILGGSGYAGGELLRLLVNHPNTEIVTVTSRRYAGEPVYVVHPNLRGRTSLRFDNSQDGEKKTHDAELVFLALPYGKSTSIVPKLLRQGKKVVDLGADFRLKSPDCYRDYYKVEHKHPELLEKAAYGLPELHRKEIKHSSLVSVPGCMATASIIGLAPLVKNELIDEDHIIVDAKVGSSGAGVSNSTPATHHSEREGGVRPYKITGHRHTAEIEQELQRLNGKDTVRVSFTPHAVGMVRGILATIHTFTSEKIEKKDVWKAYRSFYSEEPFVRMVSDNRGLYGLPNPKSLVGTNYCDVGFDLDSHSSRLLAFAAIDNLTKGAAGQAVQCYNIMTGVDERTGLEASGLHP